MKRWRGVLLALVPVGFLLLFGITWISGIHVDGTMAVGVRGRLVDAKTGTPISSAWVMSFPRGEWAEDTERAARYRNWNAEYLAEKAACAKQGDDAIPPMLAPQCGGGTTDEDGRFEFDVGVRWSWSGFSRFVGGNPPARHGVAVLRVEAPNRPARILDLRGGDWRESDERNRPYWATWDLREIRVSFDE